MAPVLDANGHYEGCTYRDGVECTCAKMDAIVPELRNSVDAVIREADGTFARGKSPNPGGQAKWLKEVRQSLRDLTPLAAKTLKQVMEEGAKDSDKTAAAKVVLEYTVPKPKQTHRVEGKGGDPLASLTAEQLVAFVTGRKG